MATSSRLPASLGRVVTDVSRSAHRTFSTSLSRNSRRQVLVELKNDVKGLGQIYDRMVVNPGRARNELVPEGSARMVPWKRKSERDSFLRSVRAVGKSPAGADSSTLASASIPSSSTGPTPAATLDALYALPPSISFHRRTTAPTATSIHGSLSLGDIQLRLQDDYGLSASDVEVVWKDETHGDVRLRQLGNFDCAVRIRGRGQESAPLVVNVIRLEE